MRSAELQESVHQQVLLLSLELPVFPHAVLYQQPLTAAAVVAQAAAKKDAPGAFAAAAAAGQVPWGPGSGSDIIRFHDPEVRYSAKDYKDSLNRGERKQGKRLDSVNSEH
jgi:hypothetical protein